MQGNDERDRQRVVDNRKDARSFKEIVKDFFKPKGDMTIEQVARRKRIIAISIVVALAVIVFAYPIVRQTIARKKAQKEDKISHEVITEDQQNEDWKARVDESVIDVKKENEELRRQNEEILKKLNEKEGAYIAPESEVVDEQQSELVKKKEPEVVSPGMKNIADIVLPKYPEQNQMVSPNILPQTPQKTGLQDIPLPPQTATRDTVEKTEIPTSVANEIYVFRQASREASEATKRRGQFFLPTGSFMKGRLLSGVEAPTGGIGEKTPVPVVINLDNESYLPNEYRTDLIDCFLVGSAKGNASTIKADIRLVNIACVDKKKRVMSKTVQGWVFGPDGKYGVRGTQVSQQGAVLRMHLLAAMVEGFGGAYKDASSNIVTTAEGTVSSVDPSKAFKVGAYNALGEAGASLASFYLDMAKSLIPIIEVPAGVEISIVLEQDLEIDFDDFKMVTKNPLAKSNKIVE